MPALLTVTPDGLYCPAGDFHIDPWRAVPRAVITHAHADHARPGCGAYLAAEPAHHIMRTRLGNHITLETMAYGEERMLHPVKVSLHPAGHVLGSAQIRLEHAGEVWVVSGDYKTEADPTCTPFEPVRCHTFITESTFGLPIYRWEPPEVLFAQINAWWRANVVTGKCSILYAYALGKSQRLLAGLDPSIGPIYLHGAVETVTRAYRHSGVSLPATQPASVEPRKHSFAGAMVIAPPSAAGSPWAKRFEPASDAMASGWMRVRGTRRRRALDRGFVVSDHADWPGLLSAIKATGASTVLATHGFQAELARYLTEQGLDGRTLATQYQGELDDAPTPEAE